MLNIYKINKSFGADTLLEDVSFVVNAGERVGLIGPNGCGKSTLLRIIAAEDSYDSGSVSVASGTTVGYLPQGLPFDDSLTAGQVIRNGLPEWEAARVSLASATSRMASLEGEALEYVLAEYGKSLERFEAHGGYTVENRIEKLLRGLGLSENIIDRPVSELSGGQRTRIGLAAVLLAEPNLLLLDEPTNHLDIDALEWLESFLSDYPGGVLLASHDRVFLDRTVTRVVVIDPETHNSREYAGNYSYYAELAAQELSKNWQQWQDQQSEIKRLKADIHKTKMHAQSVELTTTSRQPNVRRYAKKVAKKALSREKKLNRYLDAEDRVGKPKKGWRMKLQFDEEIRSGQVVLDMENVTFGYENSTPVLNNAKFIIRYGERIALVGPNGSGKSTLIKLIANFLRVETGRIKIGSSVKLGYMPQEQETLPPDQTPLNYIRRTNPMSETEARNFLHNFLFEGDDALRQLTSLSFGERARLILAGLVTEGANFLVLDEPVNHLDIPSREQFETALDAFPGTVLAAVHDRAFIQNFATRVIRIDSGKIVG